MESYTIKRENGEVIELSWTEARKIHYEFERDANEYSVSDYLYSELDAILDLETEISDDEATEFIGRVMKTIGSEITDEYERAVEDALEYDGEWIADIAGNYYNEIRDMYLEEKEGNE